MTGVTEAAGMNGHRAEDHNTWERKQATFSQKWQRKWTLCVIWEDLIGLSVDALSCVWCVSAWCMSGGNIGSFLVWMSAAAPLYRPTFALWLMWGRVVSGTRTVISFPRKSPINQLWKSDQWLNTGKHLLFPCRSIMKGIFRVKATYVLLRLSRQLSQTLAFSKCTSNTNFITLHLIT